MDDNLRYFDVDEDDDTEEKQKIKRLRTKLNNTRKELIEHHYRLAEIDTKTEHEAWLRKKNPGLKEAWDKYQVMLQLSKVGGAK